LPKADLLREVIGGAVVAVEIRRMNALRLEMLRNFDPKLRSTLSRMLAQIKVR
jgi:hypothetical protein